jgi:hypothetical protein
MNNDRSWLRIVGGGCFLNIAIIGLLMAFFTAGSLFTIDSIVFPFLLGSTVSFAATFHLLRQVGDQMSMARKLSFSVAGVVLGAICAVLGIAAIMLLTVSG